MAICRARIYCRSASGAPAITVQCSSLHFFNSPSLSFPLSCAFAALPHGSMNERICKRTELLLPSYSPLRYR